uniref:Uncharacterized protein n=1 Tax=Trichuris muris TaxID=70415 RepID=A0A5S6QDL2_TRIMR
MVAAFDSAENRAHPLGRSLGSGGAKAFAELTFRAEPSVGRQRKYQRACGFNLSTVLNGSGQFDAFQKVQSQRIRPAGELWTGSFFAKLELVARSGQPVGMDMTPAKAANVHSRTHRPNSRRTVRPAVIARGAPLSTTIRRNASKHQGFALHPCPSTLPCAADASLLVNGDAAMSSMGTSRCPSSGCEPPNLLLPLAACSGGAWTKTRFGDSRMGARGDRAKLGRGRHFVGSFGTTAGPHFKSVAAHGWRNLMLLNELVSPAAASITCARPEVRFLVPDWAVTRLELGQSLVVSGRPCSAISRRRAKPPSF